MFQASHCITVSIVFLSSFLIRVAVFLPKLGKHQRCARSALWFGPAQHRLWAALSCCKARHPEDIALDQSCVCLHGPQTIQRTSKDYILASVSMLGTHAKHVTTTCTCTQGKRGSAGTNQHGRLPRCNRWQSSSPMRPGFSPFSP